MLPIERFVASFGRLGVSCETLCWKKKGRSNFKEPDHKKKNFFNVTLTPLYK